MKPYFLFPADPMNERKLDETFRDQVATVDREEWFKVTQIGCGFAGWTKEIAPLFIDANHNCQFDTAWEPFLLSANHLYRAYWGTY